MLTKTIVGQPRQSRRKGCIMIRGLLPVVPTPFADGQFDQKSFRRLVEHILPHLDGYTLLGSTGEAPSLTVKERMRITEFALDCTPPGKTVVVGVSSTCLEDSVALARHAERHGAHGVLCSAPYYFVNTAKGVCGYLARIDAAIERDLVLYDNPVSTGTVLRTDDVIEWSQRLSHLRTVKLTDHDLTKIGVWQRAGLSVLAGDDPIISQFLAGQVDGAMVIAPAIFPESAKLVWDLTLAGDDESAFGVLATDILPFVHAFGIGDEITTAKSILADMGIFESREVLPPLEPASEARQRLLRHAYHACRGASQRHPLLQSTGQH
jgi:4-hydroxy-tetrahydrodipicolinate synthase